MERPNPLDAFAADANATPSPRVDARPGALELATGARAFVLAQSALLTISLIGMAFAAGRVPMPELAPAVVGPYAIALALACAAGAGLFIALDQVRRHAPAALHDRSPTGCAWYGAGDEVVVGAFLVGGTLACLWLGAGGPVVLDPPIGAAAPFAEWPLLPAMILAFAVIAILPVAEELLLRGVLFATLCRRLPTLGAALAVTAASVPSHHLLIAAYPRSAMVTLAIAALAMQLRLRHASLAPAIALHCGHNFTVCVAMALG